jgi:hypothetical protein
VNVEVLCHVGRILPEFEPGEHGLGHPLTLARAQPRQRGELAAQQRLGQVGVAEQQQRGEVLVAADRVAAQDPAPGQRQRLPGPAQRPGRVDERHGRPDRRVAAAQRPVDHARPAGSVGVGQHQHRFRPGPVGQRVTRKGWRRRGGIEHDHGDPRGQRPAGRARQASDQRGVGGIGHDRVKQPRRADAGQFAEAGHHDLDQLRDGVAEARPQHSFR